MVDTDDGGKIVQLAAAIAERSTRHRLTEQDVRRAEDRLLPHLRYTPLLQTWLTRTDGSQLKVSIKLENLQIAESFAVRGVLNAALTLPHKEVARGLVGYGRTHGAAVAYTAHVLQVPAVVYLFERVATEEFQRSLEAWGATVVLQGQTRAEARTAAAAHAERDRLMMILPTSPGFIAGCATIALEILEFAPEVSVFVTAVGFGTLVTGMALYAHLVKPDIRVIGVDRIPNDRAIVPLNGRDRTHRFPIGTLLEHAGPAVRSQVERHADAVILVTEAEARHASQRLWSEMEVRTGGSGSAAIAALLSSRAPINEGEEVAAVISTSGDEGLF